MFAIFFEGDLEVRAGPHIDEAAAEHERRGSIPSGGTSAGLSAQVSEPGEELRLGMLCPLGALSWVEFAHRIDLSLETREEGATRRACQFERRMLGV